MSILTHVDPDCQPIGSLEGEEEIPFDTGPIFRLATVEVFEDYAGTLLAEYHAGTMDAAGADAAVMSYEEWTLQVPIYDYADQC